MLKHVYGLDSFFKAGHLVYRLARRQSVLLSQANHGICKEVGLVVSSSSFCSI
jgi:hypothetical protein